MNCLLFQGSARKGGNTDNLLQKIIQGIENVQGSYKLYRLPDLDIHPCIGCGSCEENGECIFKDDMYGIYQSIRSADRILVASPIYFYNLTAQTKLFIDRCQTLWSRKYLLNTPAGNINKRKGYLVSVAATHGKRVFEGAKLTMRYAFDAMNCTYTDDLLVKGMDQKDAVGADAALLQKAVSLGESIAAN